VEKTNRGIPIIHEAGLEELLKKNIGNRFSASTDCIELFWNPIFP
jgi:UDP-glucose 6-dehydrogenase